MYELTDQLALWARSKEESPEQTFQRPKTCHVTRVLNALRKSALTNASKLASKIQHCRKGQVCSSLYCGRCRHRAVKSHEGRLKEHIDKRFGGDHVAAREELRYVTVLLDLISILDEPRRTKQVITEARKCFKALKRAYPSLWFQGVFELELVDFKALLAADGGQVKSKTIAQMIGWKDEWGTRALDCQPTLVLVHCHILVDLNGAAAGEVTEWLKNRYDRASRQVDIRRTRQDQSLGDLCWKIGSYPFKDRVQFNMSFATQAYRDGNYFSDKELARLVMLYDNLSNNGYKQLLLGSKPRALCCHQRGPAHRHG